MKEQLLRTSDSQEGTDMVCEENNFVVSLLEDIAKSALENGIGLILSDINQTTGDVVTGTLLALLEGTGDKSLEKIEQQIIETQEMIQTLQSTVDDLQSTVNSSFKMISKKLSRSDFNKSMDLINSTYNTINSLQTHYNDIIRMCYDGDKVKKEFSDYDKANIADKINVFSAAIESANIEKIIDALAAQTSPTIGDSTYHIANDYFTKYYSFKHQTYKDTYNLLNLISSIRTTSLYLYKEYQSYKWKTSNSNITLEDYLNNHYINIYNRAVNSTNKEVKSEASLNDLATKLLGVQTDDKIKYLENTINIIFTYAYNNNTNDVKQGKAYKIEVNNLGKDNCYIILKESLKLNFTSWTTSYKYHRDIVTQYHYGVADPISTDTRYIPVDSQNLLKGLLINNTGSNQTDFLVSNLPELDSSTNGFALKEDEKVQETPKNKSNYLGVYTRCYQYLNLLDGRNFDPSITDISKYYVKDGKDKVCTLFADSDITFNFLKSDGTKEKLKISDAKFFVIFKDTNIKS